jgi:hypothetical protein
MTSAGFEVITAMACYEEFYLPLKCWLFSLALHSVISQKTELFITLVHFLRFSSPLVV